MKQPISQLKAWFKKGLFPTESQFADWLDSYFHKDDKLPVVSIDGLPDILNQKAGVDDINQLNTNIQVVSNNVYTVEKEIPINLGGVAYRTLGYVYLIVPQTVYDNLYSEFWAFSKIISVVDIGDQDTAIEPGYEPLRIISENELESSLIYFDTESNKPVLLKDIMNKIAKYRIFKNQPSLSFGISESSEVDPSIIPADAEIIETLSDDYVVNEATPSNVKFEFVSEAGLFVNLTAGLTSDKKKTIYLGSYSANSLTITGGVEGDETLPVGGKADLFYSFDNDEWTVEITAPEVVSSYNSMYVALRKTRTRNSSNWFKLATLKTETSYLGKIAFVFDIFSAETPHLGVYFARCYVNLRASYNNAYYGKFMCIEWNSYGGTSHPDPIFSPEDLVVTYSYISAEEGYELSIWKKCHSVDETYFLGVELVDNHNEVTYFTEESVSELPAATWQIPCTFDDLKAQIELKADQTALDDGLGLKADKATTYTKTEVDNKLSSVYKYKGSVADMNALPTTGVEEGWVYNVVDAGSYGSNVNFAWNGSDWDDIGGVEALATATNNGLMSKEDFAKLSAIDDALYAKKANYVQDSLYLNATDLLARIRSFLNTWGVNRVNFSGQYYNSNAANSSFGGITIPQYNSVSILAYFTPDTGNLKGYFSTSNHGNVIDVMYSFTLNVAQFIYTKIGDIDILTPVRFIGYFNNSGTSRLTIATNATGNPNMITSSSTEEAYSAIDIIPNLYQTIRSGFASIVSNNQIIIPETSIYRVRAVVTMSQNANTPYGIGFTVNGTSANELKGSGTIDTSTSYNPMSVVMETIVALNENDIIRFCVMANEGSVNIYLAPNRKWNSFFEIIKV